MHLVRAQSDNGYKKKKKSLTKYQSHSLKGFTGVVLLQLCGDRDPLVIHFPVKRPSHGVARLCFIAKAVVVDDINHRAYDSLPVLGDSV